MWACFLAIQVSRYRCEGVVDVVVELPQMPVDDPPKRFSCAWKAGELIVVGALV